MTVILVAKIGVKNRLFMIIILCCWVFVSAPGFSYGQVTERLPFQKHETLEGIKYKIDYNGYNFTVGRNWVYDMPADEKERFFSRRPSTRSLRAAEMPENIGPLLEKLTTANLPSSFDWRNHNGHSYIGPVRNQGNCGSCYAFAAAAAAEGTYNFAMGKYDGNCADFSEAFVAWCLGSIAPYSYHFYGCDGADYDYFELQALVDIGIGYESDLPYDPSPYPVPQCTIGQYPTVQFQSWHRIPCNDIDAVKTAIMTYGPVDAAVYTTDSFVAYSGGVYEDTNTSCDVSECYNTQTDHAISLVGWNDDGDPENNGYWILRNSWGSTDWGENGYMRIKYKAAVVACSATYLVAKPRGRNDFIFPLLLD